MLPAPLKSLARSLWLPFEKLRLSLLHHRFRRHTMLPRPLFVANLLLARRVRGLPGCVVECGVWRGGMSAGLAAVLGPQRDYFLFDSFAGLPPAQPIDGDAALAWQGDPDSPHYHNNCTASRDDAAAAMRLAGCPSATLVPGWFEDTLPRFIPPTPIALLRLDADWFDSTLTCLKALFPQVAPGGLILVDDYYTWDGCSRALHAYLSQTNASERIQCQDGVAFLVKN